MGRVIHKVADRFQGVHDMSLGEPTSTRNDLPIMKDNDQIFLNSRRQLWMPPAFTEIHEFTQTGTDDGEIMPIQNGSVMSFSQPGSGTVLLPNSWHIIHLRDGSHDGNLNKINADGTVNGTEGVGGNTWPIDSDFANVGVMVTGFDSSLGYVGYVYNRGAAGGVEAFRLYNTTGDPGALQATDITSDWGHATFGRGQAVAYHQGRIFQGGLQGDGYHNRIIFSDIDSDGNQNLETYDTDDWFDLPTGQVGLDESVRALVSWNAGLLIFTHTSIWLLRGDNPQNFDLDKLNMSVGASSPRAVAVYEGDLYFTCMVAGSEGFYRMDGSLGVPTLLSAPVGDQFRRLPRPSPTTGNANTTLRPAVAIWDGRAFITMRDPTREDNSLPRVLVCDINGETPEWTFMDDGWDYTRANATGPPTLAPELTPHFWTQQAWQMDEDVDPQADEGGANLLVGDWNKLLATRYAAARHSQASPFVELGWFDDDTPHETKRWLACKFVMWKEGTGDVPYTIDFTTETGQTVQKTGNVTATSSSDSTDREIIHAVGMRSRQIDIKITFSPSADDQQVVVEQLELQTSQKRPKAGGGDFG